MKPSELLSGLVFFAFVGHNYSKINNRQLAQSQVVLTLVQMCLLRQFIIRIAISINRSIQLLERHKCSDKFIVSVEKCSKPLFRLHMLDLGTRSAECTTNLSRETYVSQNFAAKKFTEFEMTNGSLVLRNPLLLAIDQS